MFLRYSEGAGNPYCIAFDEAGRGSLFGPVTVGAVVFYQSHLDSGELPEWAFRVTDSKLLKSQAREELLPLIETSFLSGYAHGSVWYIDAYNINRAIEKCVYKLAQNISSRIGYPPAFLVMDGNYTFRFGSFSMPKFMPPFTSVVKGDLLCFPISCASIIAKTHRDALLEKAQPKYAKWAVGKHKGYGTTAHMQAIQRYGLTRFHRKSFCKKFL